MKKGPFSFTAESSAIEAVLKKIQAVQAGVSEAEQFFVSTGKAIFLVGQTNESFLRVQIPATNVSGVGAVCLNDKFAGAIKGRAELNFSYKSVLSIAQVKGRYKFELNVADITPDHEAAYEAYLAKSKKADALIDGAVLATIRTGLSLTNIKDVYNNNVLQSYIDLQKGRLSISSFDSQHFGSFKTKVDSSVSFKVALPATHFTWIDSIAAGAPVSFSIAGGCLCATGKGFAVVLPAVQTEDEYFTMTSTFIDSLKSKKVGFECSVDLDALRKVAENLFTLYSVDTAYTLHSQKEGTLSVDFTTSAGSASDTLKVASKSWSKVKAGVDPRLFRDILDLAAKAGDSKLSILENLVVLRGVQDGAQVFLACSRTE